MEAMFTATPVTVPARCLQGRKSSLNTSSQPYTPLPPPYLSLPVRFIPLDPLPGLVHLDVLIAVARDAKDTPQGIADAGGRGAEGG